MNDRSCLDDSTVSIVGSPNVRIENNLLSLWGYFLKSSLLEPILKYLVLSNEVGIIFAVGITNITILSFSQTNSSKKMLC